MASPGHLVSVHNHSRRGPTGWSSWCPSPLRAFRRSWPHHYTRKGSSGWRHWRPPPLRVYPAKVVSREVEGLAPLVPVPLVPSHFCHCRPCRSHSLRLQGIIPLAQLARCRYSMYRTSKLHDTMRGKPTYPIPVLPLPVLVLSPFVRPLCLSLAVCGAPALCAVATRCMATHGAAWFLCCSASGCSRSLPVSRSCPSACSLRRSAHCAEQAMCKAPLFSSLRHSRLHPFLGPLLCSCPLLPFLLSYPAPSVPLPSGHDACQYAVHLARHSPFHKLDTSILVTFGRLARRLHSPAGVLAVRGAPGRGCRRGILPPNFRLVSHLRVTAPPYAGHTEHASAQAGITVRKMHNMLCGTLPFGPFSLSRSLSWSFALCAHCAPWPLLVCVLSRAVCSAPVLYAEARTVHSDLRGTLDSLLLPLWLLSVPPYVPALSYRPLPLPTCARCRAMCEAPLLLSLRLSRLLPPLGPLCRSHPLLPPRLVLPLPPLFRPPRGTMHVSMQYTLHDTYLLTTSSSPSGSPDALSAACTAAAGFPAAGGLAVRGTPGRGCCRGILSPVFRLVSHVRVTAPACAGRTYHAPAEAGLTARKVNNKLHGMLPFGPCSLTCSLSVSLALCAPPWLLTVCSLSYAHGAQRFAGHPLPAFSPGVPSHALVCWLGPSSLALPLCAHGA